MKLIAAVTFVSALLAAPAIAAEPAIDPSFRGMCTLICGVWAQESTDPDQPSMRLQLKWDDASGTITGQQIFIGGGGRSRDDVNITIRYDLRTGTARLERVNGSIGETSSIIEYNGSAITARSIVPGHPEITEFTVFAFPQAGIMIENHTASGEHDTPLSEVRYSRMEN